MKYNIFFVTFLNIISRIRNWSHSYYLISLILLFCLLACTSEKEITVSHKVKILTTTSIIGDVVSNITGEIAEVHVLLSPGNSPHRFEASPKDIAKVNKAAIIFTNGAGLEGFLDRLIENSGTKAKNIDLSATLKLINLAEKNHLDEDHLVEHGQVSSFDPHVWLDPFNVIEWSKVIADQLSELDSQHAHHYKSYAEKYIQELTELDHWIERQIALIPETKRLLVTDHRLFGYFAKRYGFKQVGAIIPGFSTLSEPSARDLARLENEIRHFKVKAILIGNTDPPDLARRLAADTGIDLVQIYTGSLSEKGGVADTYIRYMQYNVMAIVQSINQ